MARLLCVYGARMVYAAGMVTNFVGIQKDFTVVAGTRADVGIRLVDADGRDVDVGLCTWRLGIWRDGDAAVAVLFGELLERPQGARVSDLFWRFPVLEAGLWRYELVATDSEGEAARVFYGVVGSREASDIVAGSPVIGVKGWRMLEAQLPVEAGGKLQARWLSGDYVAALCEIARGHAERAEAVEAELDAAVKEATERAEAAAERAEESATEAAGCAKDAETAQAGAVAARTATEKKLAGIDEVLRRWDERVSSAIYPSSETGTWVVGDYVTGAFWQGPPAHIGTSGNWMNWNMELQRWEDSGVRAAAKDGFSPYVDSAGYWVYVDPVTGELRQGALAAGKNGIDGTAVRRIMVDSYDDIPQEGETCNGGHYYYVPDGDGGWNVYAWLETPAGDGGWVFVGLANDIATAEVYGLMKYGTDEVVVNGAPVGRDADGKAHVPVAEPTVPGVVRPTNELIFESGGGTHMTSNNELRVDDATTIASGTVLLSYDGLVDTACIGLTADFRISVPWATLTQEGVLRLGSKLPHVNGRPYIVGIGATANHEIAFNVLTGGALKHLQGQTGWVSGTAPGVNVSGLDGDSIFFGLDTSDSFSQAGGKLSLNEATTSLLGGVRKMLTLGSGTAVPTGSAVMDYLARNYYTKSQTYTKTELTRDGGIIELELKDKLPIYAEQELAAYLKKVDVEETFARASVVTELSRTVSNLGNDVTAHGNSINAIQDEVKALQGADSGCVKVVGAFAGAAELWFGTAEEFSKQAITGKRMFLTLGN